MASARRFERHIIAVQVLDRVVTNLRRFRLAQAEMVYNNLGRY